MRTTKKILSMILAFVLVLGLLPATAFATGADSVYISVSYDGQYINDKNGNAIAYIPVSFDNLASIDLDEYGLSEYKYDEDGDGTYDITALHMVIYAHENLYGGKFSDVEFTGGPGSSYFQGGIFGFDENLNYFLNGEYPLAGEGWGATSDQIVLEAGDFIDIGSFSSWDFYMDSNYGFHFFADESGAFIHDYTAEAGSACSVKLVRSYSGMGTGAVVYDASDYTVYYGTSYGNATGSVTTDGSGCAEITFPEAGNWILWADGGYGNEYSDVIVSAPAYAKVTVTAAEAPAPEEPEQPREAQSVTTQMNATMAQLAATVTEPVFGTTAGEWTVLCLARGGYYAKDNAYFTDYYNRIVETVNTTATKVDMSGALHKSKSTENSRLIVALSALGIDATSVGDWDLVEAYSANGFSWIKKQGLNGTIWTLIALDSNNYATSDPTIRQQCIDAIVAAQHDDGGWSLMANKTFPSDPDITGMALTALYPYRNQREVAEACGEAFDCLSAIQNDDGTYSSGGAKCSESCSWVIVSTTMWGINPDTDSRFIKNGKSVVDGLLAHYLPDSATFQHIIGAGSNAMATDQSCYALVAYDRFLNSKPALFDYSDVTFGMVPFFLVFESRKPKARELVTIAVLCAIAIAGRSAFFMLPQFKPVLALVIISGVAFGGETGFLVGAVTMMVSNVLFSQGPWMPWQMFSMGIIGFLAGVLFRKGLLRRSRGSLATFGAFAAVIIYGGIMNPAAALMYNSQTINLQMLKAYYVSGLPMDLIHAAATAVFILVAAEPMLEKLDRIKVKYGLVE